MARTAWLLDTNVLSEMMRPIPEPRVSRFRNTGVDTVNPWAGAPS